MASRRRTRPTVTPPSTARVSARQAAGNSPYPLTSGPANDPVTVVHLAAELAPFARTGGLGEAVSSLAHYQARSGITSIIMMPLYKQVLEVVDDLEPVGDPSVTLRRGALVVQRHVRGAVTEPGLHLSHSRAGLGAECGGGPA